MPPFRYRLIDSTGRDIGPFVSSRDDWRPGDTIPRDVTQSLRVKAVVEPMMEESFRAYLIVQEVDAEESAPDGSSSRLLL